MRRSERKKRRARKHRARQLEREEKEREAEQARARDHHRKQHGTPRRPTTCQVCGATLEGLDCRRCGATLQPPFDQLAQQVRLVGKIVAVGDEEAQFDLLLSSDVTVRVEVTADARWLPAEAETEDSNRCSVGTAAAVIGTAGDVFDEQVGGLREAAQAEHRLAAAVVATGENAAELLEAPQEPTPPLVEDPPSGEPPYPVEVYWDDEPASACERLFIFHRPREPTNKIRGPIALGLAMLAVIVLTQVTGSGVRALELFNAAALWIIPPAPFLIYVVVMAVAGGRRIVIDAEQLRWGYTPAPWRPGWRVPVAQIKRIYRHEQTLCVERRDGRRHRLLPEGTVEQLDYVQVVVSKMMLDGPGPWIENVLGEKYRGRLFELLLALLLLVPGFGALLLAKACPWD